MSGLKFLFWNSSERRLRAMWRLFLYLLIVAAIANPLILLLDETGNRLLETSLENACIAIGFWVALVLSARFLERHSLAYYGLLRSRAWWVELTIGFGLGGLIMTIAFVIQYLSGWIVMKGALQTTLSSTPFFLAFLGNVIRYFSGSFFEELFSRGYLLRLMEEAIRKVGINQTGGSLLAATVTSLFFGLLHGFNPGASLLSIINLTLLGFLFALPMIVTGRLALSIGLHAGWNILQNNIFGLPNSGQPSNTFLLAVEDVGPVLWTGGSFGPEGGLVALVTILFGLILVGGWLWIATKRRDPIVC